MNRLPANRQAINGRTHSQSWSASSFDPISHYAHPRSWAGPLLATAIAVGLALVVVMWIDWSLA